MSLSNALAAVEEIGLDVLEDGEPSAARRVRSRVLAVGTGDAAGDGTCGKQADSSIAAAPIASSRKLRTLRRLQRQDDGERSEELLEGHGRLENA